MRYAAVLSYGLGEAFRGMRARSARIVLFCAAAIAMGFAITLAPGVGLLQAPFAPVEAMFAGVECLLAVAFFFILADAVRIERPLFAMNARAFGMWVLLSWAYIAQIAFGIAFFVVPGIAIAVKLAPWTAYYLLGDDLPYAHALRDTNGRFWETLALLVTLWLLVEGGLIAAGFLAALLVTMLSAAAIVALPLLFVAGYYLLAVACSSWIRYSAALRTSTVHT